MKKVLFTRVLTDFDHQLCKSLGLQPVILPLIKTESIPVDEILQENTEMFSQLREVTAVAFTSQHAVDALFGQLPPVRTGPAQRDLTNPSEQILAAIQPKPVYTVGEVTADMLDAYGIMARFPEDYNGTVLAGMMLDDGVHTSVIHFCGDVRRPEFREKMGNAGVEVHQIEVYRKVQLTADQLPTDTDKTALLESIDAVTFYSPSAVRAFFQLNLQEYFDGPYFTIGETTSAELQNFGVESGTPRIPTSELLIRHISKHFTS